MITISNGVVNLGEFSLKVPELVLRGDCYHVLGSNGSGKSTFLKVLAGIIELSEGKRKAPLDLKVGYVPQNYRSSLMPWLTAQENVELLSNTENCIDNLLKLGLNQSDLRKRPYQLSGGQCQRVAIARDAISRHDILLLDEPFSGLDINTVPLVGKLLNEKVREGMKVVLTSHTPLPESLTKSINLSSINVVRVSEKTAEIASIK